MRTKALLIAARPEPFTGRWIKIDDAEEWRAVPRGDYGDLVNIEVESSDGRLSKAVPVGSGVGVSGARVRAVVVRKDDEIKIVTVKLIEVRNAS